MSMCFEGPFPVGPFLYNSYKFIGIMRQNSIFLKLYISLKGRATVFWFESIRDHHCAHQQHTQLAKWLVHPSLVCCRVRSNTPNSIYEAPILCESVVWPVDSDTCICPPFTSPSLFLLSILRTVLRSLSFHQAPKQPFENLIWCDSHIYFSARITVALRSALHASLHRWAVTYRKPTARNRPG